METFAAVAAAASFSAAARRLGLSPSAVSKLVTRLERRLGVRLVARSTHGLALTAEGARYAIACRDILERIDDAEVAICGKEAALSGPLRVSSSGPLAFHVLAPLLPGFRARYPGIGLAFLISDSLIDLIEERADVALRIGPLPDSTLTLRRLGKTRMVHVAAPGYLASRGVPDRADDLTDHTVIGFPLDRRRDGMRTEPAGIATDSGELLRHLALHGFGIARLARFHVTGDLARGDLVEVLKHEATQSFEAVSAVFPSHRQPAPRVAAFVDYLIRATKQSFEHQAPVPI